MRTKSILAKCKKGQCPQDTTPPAKPHMALRLLSSISLSSTWVNAGLYYREMILLVNCFLVRDAVAFLPLHCFHFSVAPFSYGRDGVVLSPKFTAMDHFCSLFSFSNTSSIIVLVSEILSTTVARPIRITPLIK